MVRHGKTKFQDQWFLDPEVNSWLRKIPNDVYSASCTLCPGTVISVMTMGRQALISHSKSKRHCLAKKAQVNQQSVGNFFLNKSYSKSPENSKQPASQPSTSSAINPFNPQSSEASSSSTLCSPKQSKIPVSVDKFILSSEVTRVEIIWCLNAVLTHRSNRSAANDIQILKYMFPDNEVLNKMSLERTKIGYLVVFGLAPYFKQQLLEQIKDCQHFVISFDESLNKVSQSQQMDIVIRFWNYSKGEVSTRYLTSAFLKKGTATHLLSAFLSALSTVDLNSLIQISMDGPNVNKKFLTDLEEHLKDDLKLRHTLLNLGTCGLHTLHCAFKGAINSTNWNIIPYIRAVYYYFKDHPARRGAFTQATGSTTFPKKFCAIRWLENESVAENAIHILPHLKVYFSVLKQENNKLDTKSLQIILDQLKDPLLAAKLAFFKTLSSDMQPLLCEFQSDVPLAPFLYTSLKNLVLKEMERFVIPDKIQASMKVLKKSENFLTSSKVNVGIGAKSEIGKATDNVTTLQVNTFKNECKIALKLLVERILEKSPLNYESAKYLTSLDPSISCTEIGHKRFEEMAILLTKSNLTSSQTAEKALREFKAVCLVSLEKLKSFRRIEKVEGSQKNKVNRLDHFWMSLLKDNDLENSALAGIIKMLLILSHGNAHVERGFSVNKECIVENMKEESLVSIRTVHDAITYYGSVNEVPITKSLILASKNARGKYVTALEEQKKVNEEEAAKRANKRRNQFLVRELEEKKQRLMDDARKEAELIEKKISNLVH